jgi:hypothetical protein
VQHVQKILPRDSVEGFGYVQLEEQSGGLAFVEVICQVLYIKEVVLDASSGDEGALTRRDELIKVRLQST